MACEDVGDSNTDIAGLGIILALVIQAALSLILAIWSAFIDGSLTRALDSYSKFSDAICSKLFELEEIPSNIRARTKSNVLFIRHQLQRMYIEQMSETIIDVQILNGLSLLIGAMAQSRSLNLYHYHIIYDTVNLTGVSICTALTSIIENKRSYNRDRSVMIALAICLYIAFIGLFGMKLNKWNDKVPGHCYYAVKIPFLNRLHPLTDILYLTSTCISFSNSMGFCGAIISSSSKLQRIYAQRFPNKKMIKLPFMLAPHDYKALLLLLATFQYAIHIYMIFAMRAANEHYLKGDSENSWGFGQVVAMVLLGSSVLQGVRATIDYHKTTKEKSLDRLAAKKVGN